MELFKIAEKEYLDSLGPKEPEPVKFRNKHFVPRGVSIGLSRWMEKEHVMSVGWYLVRLIMFLSTVVGTGHL